MALTSMQLDALGKALKGVGNNFGSGAAIGQPTTGDMVPEDIDPNMVKPPAAGMDSGSIVHAPGPGQGPVSQGFIMKQPGPGGVGTGGKVGTGTGMGTGAGVGTDSKAIADPNLAKAQVYADKLAEMQKTPFSYSTANDPAYAAIQADNMKNSQMANKDMMEDMNSRGILNSTVTSDRATDIYKQGSDATTAAIPQLEAAAYGRHQTDIANQQGLVNTFTGLSNTQSARDVQQQQKVAQQATMSGRFWPEGAKPLVDAIMADKRAYASATPEQQKAIAADAQTKRDMLGQYGIDPRLFGSDVGIDQALANEGYGAGIRTAANEAGMANSLIGLGEKYQSMPNGLGQSIAGIGGDYKILGSLVQSLEGVPNAAAIVNAAKNQIDKQNANARTLSANKAGQSSATAVDRLKWEQDNQKEKERITISTQAEIAEALKKPTREEAYAYMTEHLDDLANRGVNIAEMATQINTSKKPSWITPKPGAGDTPTILKRNP